LISTLAVSAVTDRHLRLFDFTFFPSSSFDVDVALAVLLEDRLRRGFQIA
jgi:hypothetical protein